MSKRYVIIERGENVPCVAESGSGIGRDWAQAVQEEQQNTLTKLNKTHQNNTENNMETTWGMRKKMKKGSESQHTTQHKTQYYTTYHNTTQLITNVIILWVQMDHCFVMTNVRKQIEQCHLETLSEDIWRKAGRIKAIEDSSSQIQQPENKNKKKKKNHLKKKKTTLRTEREREPSATRCARRVERLATCLNVIVSIALNLSQNANCLEMKMKTKGIKKERNEKMFKTWNVKAVLRLELQSRRERWV